jgi:hypothetical protein
MAASTPRSMTRRQRTLRQSLRRNRLYWQRAAQLGRTRRQLAAFEAALASIEPAMKALLRLCRALTACSGAEVLP